MRLFSLAFLLILSTLSSWGQTQSEFSNPKNYELLEELRKMRETVRNVESMSSDMKIKFYKALDMDKSFRQGLTCKEVFNPWASTCEKREQDFVEDDINSALSGLEASLPPKLVQAAQKLYPGYKATSIMKRLTYYTDELAR